jgi:hypothetical protein
MSSFILIVLSITLLTSIILFFYMLGRENGYSPDACVVFGLMVFLVMICGILSTIWHHEVLKLEKNCPSVEAEK